MTQGANNQYIQMKSEKDQNGPFHRAFENTAQKVADDIGVGRSTVKRAEKFDKGVDAAETIESYIQKVKKPPPVLAHRGRI